MEEEADSKDNLETEVGAEISIVIFNCNFPALFNLTMEVGAHT